MRLGECNFVKLLIIQWFTPLPSRLLIYSPSKPKHSVYLIALLNPPEMTANHFWFDSITFGSSTKMFGAPEVCYPVFLPICVWWDTAWNKEPVVWSWCGVTLTQSSPETLHPWLQVTAPADWYPTGNLWLYQGKNLNFVNGNTHRWWHVPTQLHSSSNYSHLEDLSDLSLEIITFILKQLDAVQCVATLQSPWCKFISSESSSHQTGWQSEETSKVTISYL